MKEKLQKWVKNHKEVVQTIAVILGIVIVIGVLFVISEKTGDRSMDKQPQEPVSEELSNPLLEEGQILDETQMKEIEEITYDDFEDYLKDKKNTTVIMLGSATCSWCQYQLPILQSLMFEYDVDVKYLDVDTLEEEEAEELASLHDDLAKFGTPTFISVKNKKVRKVSPNAKTKSELVTMLTDMGIIKEDK